MGEVNRHASDRGRLHRLVIRAAAASLLVLAMDFHAAAQTFDAAKAAKVKAAYLLNFIKYTQWPQDAFATPESPIVISVVGRCDVADELGETVAQSEEIAGRRIKVDVPPLPPPPIVPQEPAATSFYETLKSSHLVYLCGVDPEAGEEILRGLGTNAQLTVGDAPTFAARGGMLGFVLRDNRILFEANLEAIRSSRIELSAKVLQLARIVGEQK